MGVVVQRTGLTSHVLRAWERRYGAVEPGRTKGGQRLYSDADVLRLRLLRKATEAGRPIGQVAELSTEELVSLVGEDAATSERASAGPGSREPHLEACLAAAERMDSQALREELMRAVVKLSAPVFVTGVVGPLLARVGELWEAGKLRPAEEHVVSTAVRQVLDWLLGQYEASGDAPLLVAATPSGELHEFGAMLAAVVAADAGWRVLYLGASLPSEEIALAAERTGAAVVAVSVVDGADEEVDRSRRELGELRAALPEGVLLVTGGRRSSDVTVEGVTRVGDLDALRQVLSAARPERGS
jgi:DNA-binding transcriptional MerR regulator/methylmalonyl-CoA mutase cobalamin-binding subunit